MEDENQASTQANNKASMQEADPLAQFQQRIPMVAKAGHLLLPVVGGWVLKQTVITASPPQHKINPHTGYIHTFNGVDWMGT